MVMIFFFFCFYFLGVAEIESVNVFRINQEFYTPQHNGKIERFNATIQNYLERLATNGLSLEQFQNYVDKIVFWYNEICPRSSNNYLTPKQKMDILLSKTICLKCHISIRTNLHFCLYFCLVLSCTLYYASI